MSDTAKYQNLFLSESNELLDKIDADLIKLEKNPQDQEVILALMRNAHTLKGEAAAMGYGEISNVTHSFEGMVENIKNKLSKGGVSLLFGALDEIKNLVAGVVSGNGQSKANILVDKVGELEAKDKNDEAQIIKTPQNFQVVSEVRVRTEKLDKLVNLAAELMVNKLRVRQDFEKDSDALDEFEHLVDEIQYQVLQLRLTPLMEVFNRFPRMIRDLAAGQNKQIDLVVHGGEIELDRSVLDGIGEPLVHLLRNAVDHGIVKIGIITLSAKRVKDKVEISVSDNGRGIDWQKIAAKAGTKTNNPELLTEVLFSGISTAEHVTEVSGRGVGLTVVKTKLAEIDGSVAVSSIPGRGTEFVMTLPVSLAIIKALLVSVNGHTFAVPLSNIGRLIRLSDHSLKKQAGQDIVVVDEQEIPLIQLSRLFNLSQNPATSFMNKTAIVTESKNKLVGFVIDRAQAQQDIIVKPLDTSLRNQSYFSAVTILGDGLPIPIIDVEALGGSLL